VRIAGRRSLAKMISCTSAAQMIVERLQQQGFLDLPHQLGRRLRSVGHPLVGASDMGPQLLSGKPSSCASRARAIERQIACALFKACVFHCSIGALRHVGRDEIR